MHILIIPLLLGVISILIKEWITYRRKRIGNITRREYEEKAARYLRQNGFKDVSLGKGSQDGGWDVRGLRGGRTRYGQCKMYAAPKKVGVKEVRELNGVIKYQRSKGIFITTYGYTKPALKFAKQVGIICELLPTWKKL